MVAIPLFFQPWTSFSRSINIIHNGSQVTVWYFDSSRVKMCNVLPSTDWSHESVPLRCCIQVTCLSSIIMTPCTLSCKSGWLAHIMQLAAVGCLAPIPHKALLALYEGLYFKFALSLVGLILVVMQLSQLITEEMKSVLQMIILLPYMCNCVASCQFLHLSLHPFPSC